MVCLFLSSFCRHNNPASGGRRGGDWPRSPRKLQGDEHFQLLCLCSCPGVGHCLGCGQDWEGVCQEGGTSPCGGASGQPEAWQQLLLCLLPLSDKWRPRSALVGAA